LRRTLQVYFLIIKTLSFGCFHVFYLFNTTEKKGISTVTIPLNPLPAMTPTYSQPIQPAFTNPLSSEKAVYNAGLFVFLKKKFHSKLCCIYGQMMKIFSQLEK